MCGRAFDFYTSLFSPDPTDPGACRVLWEELPMVSVGDRDRLELPLTLAEFSEALCRMPTNKSPGMDGLTVEFYRAFWDILGPDLATVWAESLQGGVLPLSCRRAVLALLPKKGDLHNLRNWRPVSLLSTDYKIVAKAISLRLGSVMVDVIHPDQTYTVPGRSIFDNLFLVRDLLELGRREGLSFALLSLDQEKAFDQGCPLDPDPQLLEIWRSMDFSRDGLCGFSAEVLIADYCNWAQGWRLTLEKHISIIFWAGEPFHGPELAMEKQAGRGPEEMNLKDKW
ncbi:unnamed protein product [Caretta caretta]